MKLEDDAPNDDACRLTQLSVVCMDDGNSPVSTWQLIAGSLKT